MDRLIAAAIQMNSGPDKQANLANACRLVRSAAGRGADFVALPELFNCLDTPETIVANAEKIPGPTSDQMSRLAAQLNITILAGSFAELATESQKVFNSSLLFGPDGRILSNYRKIHLFDVDLPGRVSFAESAFTHSGERLAVTTTAVGRIGQAICYDLRFSNLFRGLSQLDAEIIAVPSAFTLATGRDHWEVLLRARAIENQVFVIAPNQFGRHGAALTTFGRSMIIDPWGIVLATAPDEGPFAIAELDMSRLREIRACLPVLQHFRTIARRHVGNSSTAD